MALLCGFQAEQRCVLCSENRGQRQFLSSLSQVQGQRRGSFYVLGKEVRPPATKETTLKSTSRTFMVVSKSDLDSSDPFLGEDGLYIIYKSINDSTS